MAFARMSCLSLDPGAGARWAVRATGLVGQFPRGVRVRDQLLVTALRAWLMIYTLRVTPYGGCVTRYTACTIRDKFSLGPVKAASELIGWHVEERAGLCLRPRTGWQSW